MREQRSLSRLPFTAVMYFALLVYASFIQAQTCSEPVETWFKGWPQGSVVAVNIDSGSFSPAQETAVAQAIQDWAGTGGVTFNITYSATPISGTNTLQVNHTTFPGDPTDIGLTTMAAGPPPGYATDSGTTYINPQVTNLTAITITMAHELGHTFGLNENPSNTSSVMADGCGGYNTTTGCGTVGPTSTDLATTECHDSYTNNICETPGNSSNPNCNCGSGTSEDCSGGLTCQNGVCGCTNPCDDSWCAGYTCDACGTNCGGTCTNDDGCSGGLVCMGGGCGCSDPCDESSCSNYTCASCGTNCGGGCSNDDGCGGGLVCMGGSCGCSDPCDDSSCDGYNCANCGVNCGCSAAMPASSGAIGNIDCDNPCDMDCSNYDPDQCATGGRASNDGLTLKRMPVLQETWLPSGLALVFVLPVVFRVRRRKAGDKPSKEQKNDIQ